MPPTLYKAIDNFFAFIVGNFGTTDTILTFDRTIPIPISYLTIFDLNGNQLEKVKATLVAGLSITVIRGLNFNINSDVTVGGNAQSLLNGMLVRMSVSQNYYNNLLDNVTQVQDDLYTNNINIDGIKTFTSFPVTPSSLPVSDYEVANKKYVDDIASLGAPKATTVVYGIVIMSYAPASPTIPIAVGDNDPRVPTQNENDALVGTSGTAVSSSNKLVDADDVALTGTPNKIARRDSDGLLTIGTLLPTLAGQVIALDSGGKLPGVDGSQLLNLIVIDTKSAAGVKNSNDSLHETTSLTPVKVKETRLDENILGVTHTINVFFTLGALNNNCHAQIYKNGTPIGTLRNQGASSGADFSEDFAGFVSGDLIQIYAYADITGSAQIMNFRIRYDFGCYSLLGRTLATPLLMTPYSMTNTLT